MAFRRNTTLEDLINTHGQTFGLPLFNQEVPKGGLGIKANTKTVLASNNILPPAWIWDGSGIKAEVYNKLERSFNARQLQVLCGFMDLGKATDNDVKDYLNFEINWVCGRRNELVKMGIIISFGETKIGPYGQPNIFWHVNYKKLRELLFENLDSSTK